MWLDCANDAERYLDHAMSDRLPDLEFAEFEAAVLVARQVAFEAAFEADAHRHTRGQFVGCTHGAVTVTTDVGSWVVPPGHAVWLPPDEPHGGRSYGPGLGWSLYVAPEACQGLPGAPRTVIVPPLLREAILRCATWDGGALTEPQARIAAVILDEIAGLPAQALDLPMPRDTRLLRIAQAVLSDPSIARDLPAWAAWAGGTARTVTRRFPRETGLSFTAWRQRARLLRGLELLADGRSVTTVALDLGYGSVSAFIALFRRTFGFTPTAYAQSGGAGGGSPHRLLIRAGRDGARIGPVGVNATDPPT